MREIIHKILSVVEEICYAISFFSALLWLLIFWLGDGMAVLDVLYWISCCVPPFIFAYILHLKKESVGNMIFNKFNVKKKFADAKKGFTDIANIAKGKEPTQSQSAKTTEQANQQSSSLGTVAAAAVGAGVAATAASAQAQTKATANQASQDFVQNLSTAKDKIAEKLKSEQKSDESNNAESEGDDGDSDDDDGLLSSIFDDD